MYEMCSLEILAIYIIASVLLELPRYDTATVTPI